MVGSIQGSSGGFLDRFNTTAIGAHAALWDRNNGNQSIDLHTTYLNDQGFLWSIAQGVDASGNVYGVGGAVIDDFNANVRGWVLKKQ